MADYVIQIEGREGVFPSSIIIAKRESYERDIGPLEKERNLKIVGGYPSDLKEKLQKMLGDPIRIGLESEIFTVKKPFENCIKRIFENL